MYASLFEIWFTNQLFPLLPANSVNFMDNSKYLSQQQNKKPTKATNKGEIISFMTNNNIESPAKVTKKQLLGVTKEPNLPITYTELIKLKDKKKYYYCVFIKTELVWSKLKIGIRKDNKCPNLSGTVKDLIWTEMEKIDHRFWENYIKLVKGVGDF